MQAWCGERRARVRSPESTQTTDNGKRATLFDTLPVTNRDMQDLDDLNAMMKQWVRLAG